MDEIFEMIPHLEQLINFTLCLEETKVQDCYQVKDISLLLNNRTLENIYVIDCDEKAFDLDSCQNVLLGPYKGEKNYIELEKMAMSLKMAKEHAEALEL